MTKRWLTIGVLSVALVARVSGQFPPPSAAYKNYQDVIDGYGRGRFAESVDRLVQMPLSESSPLFDTFVQDESRVLRFERIQAAVAAHIEAFIVRSDRTNQLNTLEAQFILRVVNRVVWLKERHSDRMTPGFLRHAYLLLVATLDRFNAYTIIERLLADARQFVPNDPAVLLASGSLYEKWAGEPDRWATVPVSNLGSGVRKTGVDRSGLLLKAHPFLEQAVSLSPDLHEARLRLARVEHQLGAFKDAAAQLNTLETKALPEEFKYLARLFRAGIEEDQGRTAEAQHAYVSAMEWKTQAPFAGLAALKRSQGDAAAATMLANSLLAHPPEQDPWWVYQRGQSVYRDRRLAEVRELVRAPR